MSTPITRQTPRPKARAPRPEPEGAAAAPLVRPSRALLTYALPVGLALTILLAAAFRLYNLDWDQGQHLHPDERHLTQVVSALGWPAGLDEYFDEARSPLNPRNAGFDFFAYGTLPLMVVKAAGIALDRSDYDQIHLVGRAMSALLDLATVLLLFLLALRLYKDRRVALLAAFLLATCVLAIQHAHFFVVDPWANFFIALALYSLTWLQERGTLAAYLLTGALFGLALSSKLSVVSLALVIAAAGAYRVWLVWQQSRNARDTAVSAEQTAVRLALAALAAFAVFRVASPDVFSGPGLFGIEPSARWLANMEQVGRLVSGDDDLPPGVQWTNRPAFIFPWTNMVLWGMGIPLGLAAWAGWGAAAWRLVRRREWAHLIPVSWVAVLFLHQGTQWVKSLRYFLPIYPALALLAAWLLVLLWDLARQRRPSTPQARWSWSPAKAAVLLGLVAGGTLLWALTFASIYTQDHTRVRASRWIYANIPPGTTLANEHWDDGLPIRMDGNDPFGGMYQGLELGWFDDETPEKLRTILGQLDEAEYIILSSNRLYDTIPRLPMRYPMAIRYYQALFDGSLGFTRAAEFTAYPQLLGIAIPDQGAEEAFSVYDHPRVQIFRKTESYSSERTANILGAVDWHNVVRLGPRQGTIAPTALMLPAETWPLYRQMGTWSEIFTRQSLANQVPVLAWALVIQLLGLLALPYLFVAARGLPDRGYAFAKALGLLLAGWSIWLLASLRLLSFSREGILLLVLALGAGAVWIAHRRWTALLAFWKKRRRLILLEEGIFWACFAAFLIIRAANPDLWHPDRGGEKPMDLAFLNAVVKSPYFPPYDPWFAGGYINYYYFGFVLVGLIVKLTDIVPEVAYNLAIPSLFAMTALGAFGATLALMSRSGRGVNARNVPFALLGVVFVAVAGNLGELRLIADGLAALGPEAGGGIPGLDYPGRVLAGLLSGAAPAIQQDWWYWNASRVISHPAGEAGPINEFPWFTFLIGDLHAHMMALPLVLLLLGLALSFLHTDPRRLRDEGLPLGLLALALGALWPTNTWDFPTYGLVALGALTLREWRHGGRLSLQGIGGALGRWLALLLAAYLLYLPFHLWYGSAYGTVEIWTGSRTSPIDYLTIHGLFLFVIGAALLADLRWGQGHNDLVRALRLALRRPRRMGRVLGLRRRLVRAGLPYRLARGGLIAAGALGLALAVVGFGAAALSLWMLAATLLLLLRRRPDAQWQMALFMVAVGLTLTLLVELIVLKGDISRMNTVFKFYFQAWVLFGLAAAVASRLAWRRRRRLRLIGRLTWGGGFAILLAAALLYPLLATPARIGDRFDASVGPTLDGMAFMDVARYNVQDQQINLAADKQAMLWLQENIAGSPVIAEANTHPTLYGWGNRYATFTGLPAIAGWDWHERQQRAAVGVDLVTPRVEDVQRLYSTPDAEEAYRILRRYETGFLVVGALERIYFPAEGLEKFEQHHDSLWEPIYDQAGVQIYRVLR